MIYFILGVIVGILIRDIKCKSSNFIEEVRKNQENKGETQFFEPMSTQEKFKNAKNIDDILEDFNK